MADIDMVREFYLKFMPNMIHREPRLMEEGEFRRRVDFIREELHEFVSAHLDGDLEGAADGLVDIVYVVLGTAVQMGLPWEALFTEVQRANMDKVPGPSARSPYDALKPEGWVPPALGVLLSPTVRSPGEA